jgi:glutamate formiminotransferase
LLDVHSDPDHNRSVFTLVGGGDQMMEGILALAEQAVGLIDLRVQRGVHPRIGAVDVIPFVPLGAVNIQDCVSAAHQLGCRMAERLMIPVFFYGHAASSEQRQLLPFVRRGGFESLASRMRDVPPDEGPAYPHPTAGAVAIGARLPLVAYNVVLDSYDLVAARRIAAAIRESNGGLPGVRALGLPLASRGVVQVSLNLTNVDATSIPDAFRAVCDLASRLGIGVLESEIVGLVPIASLNGASSEDLRLRDDVTRHILELRVSEEGA